MKDNHTLGTEGELIAARYLEDMGLTILERNYSCKIGEIDLIAQDQEELVFVEVKTRSQKQYGEPREAVHKRKKNHIYLVAEYYLMKHHLENAFCRLDVMEVYVYEKSYQIHYLKNSILEKPKFFHEQQEEEDETEYGVWSDL